MAWASSGDGYSVRLKGSGMNNIVVDPIFVPEEFTLDLPQARAGLQPRGGRPVSLVADARTWIGLLAPLLGVARGACDAFIDYTPPRSRGGPDGRASAGGYRRLDDDYAQDSDHPWRAIASLRRLCGSPGAISGPRSVLPEPDPNSKPPLSLSRAGAGRLGPKLRTEPATRRRLR